MNASRLDAVAAYGRSTLRKRLYLGAFLAIIGNLVACQVALLLFGAQGLADGLGQSFYNSWIAGGGFWNCVQLMLAMLVVDGVLLVLSALVRTLRADRPLARRLAGPALCVAAVTLCAWWVHTRLDPLSDHALACVFGESTQYAPGYSDSAFADIVPGMTGAEVIARLGPPLQEFSNERVHCVRYARAVSGESGNFWLRDIVFDLATDQVTKRITGLYGI